MQPTRRDIRFDFPEAEIGHWHGDGIAVTQFLNALSVIFPEGERFFIKSIRNYRDRITDPELKQAVTAFIGQEAMHGREHDRWNNAVFTHSDAARAIEQRATRRLKRWQKQLPKSTQLAMTIGAEHLTAVLGELILTQPRFVEGHSDKTSIPSYVTMLRWHAMEEIEHKAVAFDVWRAVMKATPRAYLERSFGMLFMLVTYWPVINELIAVGIKAEAAKSDEPVNTEALKRLLYGRKGLIRSVLRPALSYFKPGFHPWQHDNRHLLQDLDQIELDYAA